MARLPPADAARLLPRAARTKYQYKHFKRAMWTSQNTLRIDNETSINLIKAYESHQLLWDPRHKDYYNKSKREEIWDEIEESFGAPKQELMAKMRSLSGSYRRERNREKKHRAKGRSYKSKWYAYDAFSFLRDKDSVAAVDLPDSKCVDPLSNDDPEDTTDEDTDAQNEIPQPPPALKANNLKRKLCTTPETTLTNSTPPKELPSTSGNDPYISFGLHIASELRKYDSLTLAHVKHAINNVIFQADTEFLQGKEKRKCTKQKKVNNIQTDIPIKPDIDEDEEETYVVVSGL